MRILVRLRRLCGRLVSDPLPWRLARQREHVRRRRGIVVLLLVDGDVETLHSGVQRVSPHSYGHRFAGVDQTARLALLLLVLYCHHIYLLFLLIFVLIIWEGGMGGTQKSKWSFIIKNIFYFLCDLAGHASNKKIHLFHQPKTSRRYILNMNYDTNLLQCIATHLKKTLSAVTSRAVRWETCTQTD